MASKRQSEGKRGDPNAPASPIGVVLLLLIPFVFLLLWGIFAAK